MCDSIRSEIIDPSLNHYFELPEKELERLRTSYLLKEQEKNNNIRRARQLDDQMLLDRFRLVDPENIVFDDGKLMDISKYNRTIQNDIDYNYYNERLTQGNSITISMSALMDPRTGERR